MSNSRCKFHAHENCLLEKPEGWTTDTPNCFGRSFNELKLMDEKFFDFMETNYPDICVEYVFECEWDRFKKSKVFTSNGKKIELWKQYQKENPDYWQDRPLKRLIPRECVRGGLLDVLTLKYTAEENPDSDLYVVDINSLYSYVSMNTKFGVGPYTVIVGEDLQYIYYNLISEEWFYKDESLQGGSAFCSILVPLDIEDPILKFKLNNTTVMAVCLACAKLSSPEPCNHKEKNRVFTGCWMMSTINQITREGYTVVRFLEVHHFPQKDYILKDYVQLLCTERLKNSNLLQDAKTVEEQNLICDNLNESMCLPDHLKIKPSDCKNNSNLKKFFKDLMNCLFGMFSRNTNNLLTKKCTTQFELEELGFKYAIADLNVFRDHCLVEYVLNDNSVPPNKSTNIYIGAEIASQAMVVLRNYILSLKKVDSKILYYDTDSIVFSLKKNTVNPLPMSPAIGHFKHVYPPKKIQSFYALGPRNYSISYLNSNNELCSIVKVKGLSLTSLNNKNIIDNNTYKKFIESNFNQNYECLLLNQIKKKTDKKTRKVSYESTSYSFSNVFTMKRHVPSENPLYKTYPFGFNCKGKTYHE